jgi:hypothetical protein
VRISQAAALRCFWHPQIMPAFSSCQPCIKPYENRSPRLLNNPFLPTLKPEEPKNFFERNELGLAFDTLEQLGHLVSCRGGFWRDLERAAENMGLMDRLPPIRKAFSDSLLRNDDLRICCDAMAAQVNWNCPDHALASDCPDALMGRFLSGRYGIYIHDGGSASVDISYGPRCGVALSASK